MLLRKRRAKRARDEVQKQVTELTDDLVAALETAREAIAKASSVAARRGAELGKQAGRRGARLGKQAGRRGAKASRQGARAARGMAGQAAERLPEPEQVADLTRRATDKLFPERARQRERAKRRRRVGILTGAGGLLGLGVLAGWLTAPKRGAETRQALKDQAAKASEKGWERTAEQRPAESEAEVTPIHQGDGASTPGPSRIPPS
jgi:gas vesicle protein